MHLLATVQHERTLRAARAVASVKGRIVTADQAAQDADLWARIASWAQHHDAGRRLCPPKDGATTATNTMARAIQRAPADPHTTGLVRLSWILSIAVDTWHNLNTADQGKAHTAHTAALAAAEQAERKAA